MTIPKTQQVPVSPGALLVAAILASASAVSHGAITNGDFTSGLTGWTPAGDAASVSSLYGVAPPSGATKIAGVSTVDNFFTSIPVANTVSGTTYATDAAGTETALGLASGTLNAAGQGTVALASGLAQQSISATAGDSITFKWNFLTGEDPGAFGKDFAFYTFHQGTGASSVNVLATSSDATVNQAGPGGALGLSHATGFQTTTITIPTTGTYTLGFGVADANNYATDSILGVASVTYTAVPEPWAWSLMSALALGGLAVARRVRYNRA